MFFVFNSILNQYKTQKICDRVFSENRFLILYFPDKCKTEKMCDDCLAALKLVPDRFVTSEMFKKLFAALYAEENILYFNEGSGDSIIFNCNGMGIPNIDLNSINLDNNFGNKFDEDDPNTAIPIRFLAWHIKFEKYKELKKELSEELMPVAWYPNRWWGGSMS